MSHFLTFFPVLLFSFVGLQVTQSAEKRPNIIFFLIDDLGWSDLGCYGSKYHLTPNIDKLAARGIQFTNAYSASSVCSPTNAMMMSEGEVIESRLETSEDITFDDYLKVIEYKTATAFETASRLGAIISGGTDVEIESLADYGKNIGIAYQIRDDLHDWKNEDKLFNLLIKNSSDPRDVFNDMEELLKKYTDRAVFSIRKIKDSQAKNNLENLVRFTTTTV